MTNYVKKFIVLISIIGLITSLFSFNVSAEVDAETGTEYNIFYYTTVIISGYCEQEVVGGKNSEEEAPFQQYRFYKNYQLSLSDETVQADIKKHTDILGEATSSYVANRNQEGVYVLNGQFKQIKAEEEAMYLNFLGLPTDFSGETIVDKEGLPITVVRDSESGLKITVKSNEKGFHEKRFVIPSQERSYKVLENVTNYTCSAGYRVPNTATATFPQDRFETYQGKSVEDVLKHCKDNNAYDIDITVHQSIVYQVVGYVSCETVLVFEYGVMDENLFNGDKNSDLTSNDSSVSSNVSTVIPKPPALTVEVVGDKEEVNSTQTSSEIIHEQTEEIEGAEETKEKDDVSAQKEDIISDQNEDSKNTVKTVKWVVIALSAVLAFALAGGGFVYIKKKRLRINKAE